MAAPLGHDLVFELDALRARLLIGAHELRHICRAAMAIVAIGDQG
jgi:hypothetical protein